MQLLNKKIREMSRGAVRLLLVLYILAVMALGVVESTVPDKITVTESELKINEVSVLKNDVTDDTVLDARLFGIIPIKEVKVEVIKENKLVPCGNVFGVKFFTKGVVIIKLSDIETGDGFMSPAKKAGLETGDIILSIDGKEINTVEEMAHMVETSSGRGLEIVYEREGEKKRCTLLPHLSLSDKKYKTGIWVRDSTAGIGTMTYYNPSTGAFAGLGHGICDVDTGELMPLLRGSVVDVGVTDIIRGRKGYPGELKGDFDSIKKGVLTKNTHVGVYGIMDENPKPQVQQIEIGLSDEMEEGPAFIMCELDEDGIKEYAVEISDISYGDEGNKSFVINVTDETLVKKTGGIVQGMSGSPVIQNGKLVGAVTHVCVNQ